MARTLNSDSEQRAHKGIGGTLGWVHYSQNVRALGRRDREGDDKERAEDKWA